MGAILTQNTAWSNVEKALARAPPSRLCSSQRLSCAGAAVAARARSSARRASSTSRRGGSGPSSTSCGREYGGRVARHAPRDRRTSSGGSCSPCTASGPRPPTRSRSTRPASRSSWWTPTRGASSRASACCGAARATTPSSAFFMARCPGTRPSTTTTTPRSCASRRRPAGRARAARAVRSTRVCPKRGV